MSTTNKSLLISYRRRQVISQNRWNKSGKWQPHLQPQTSSDKHRLIEINEAYKITRKAKPTIYTLARKGLIPAYKRGKKLYFYEDELLQWIESGRKEIQAISLQEQAAEIVHGAKRKPKGGYNF